MKFISDKEINLLDNDAFNGKQYVEVLADAILSAPNDECFTIGLFGEWGSGKSSIVRTVDDKLCMPKQSRIKFIHYDAWKYTNDSFRRTFLLKMQEDLGFEGKEAFENFYKSRSTDKKVFQRLNYSYALLSLIFLLCCFAVGWLFKDMIKGEVYAVTLIGIATLIVNWSGKVFNDYKISQTDPVIIAPEIFEDCFNEMVRCAFAREILKEKTTTWVKGKKHIHNRERLVIVIDNIDRSTKATAYELITTIKNFLGQRYPIIFLIPVDDEALKRHLRKDGDAVEADEFLRKFFNITIRLKLYKALDIFDYTEKIIREKGLELSATTVDIISKEYATNPRRIIQIVNNLSAELLLFEKKKGVIFRTEYESNIARMLVLREEWPEYYRLISTNPQDLLNWQKGIEIYDKQKAQENIRSFLTTTDSLNKTLTIELLETLLSVKERNEGFPDTLLKAILDKEYGIIESALSEKQISQEELLRKLIELLQTGIRTKRFQTYTNIVYEVFCYMSAKLTIPGHYHTRLYNETHRTLDSFIGNLNDYQLYCNYAKSIAGKFDYLQQHNWQAVKTYLGDGNKESRYQYGFQLLKAMIGSMDTKEELKTLSDTIEKSIITTPIRFKDLQIPKDKLDAILTINLYNNLLKSVKDFNQSDGIIADLIYLSEQLKFEQIYLTELAAFALNNLEKADKANLPDIVRAAAVFDELFNVQSPSKDTEFALLMDECRKKMRHPDLGAGHLKNIKEESQRIIMVAFYLNCFKMSDEKVAVNEELTILNTENIIQQYINRTLIDYREKYEFSLTELRHFILNDFSYSKENLALTELMLLHEGKQLIVDEEVVPRLARMLNDVGPKTEALSNCLANLSKNERIKQLMFEYIDALPTDQFTKYDPRMLFNIYEDHMKKTEFLLSQKGELMIITCTHTTDDSQLKKLGEYFIKYLNSQANVEDKIHILNYLERLPAETIEVIDKMVAEIKDNSTKMIANYQLKILRDINNNQVIVDITILEALYGHQTKGRMVDVKSKLEFLLADGMKEINVNNYLADGDDPAPNVTKMLKVVYARKREIITMEIAENKPLKF